MKYYQSKNLEFISSYFHVALQLFSGLFLKNVYELQFTNSEYFQQQALVL